MEVVVASQNPVKLAAVRQAFTSQLPEVEVQLLDLDWLARESTA